MALVTKQKTCPKCKDKLTYLPKKDRWYCKNCKKKFASKKQRKPSETRSPREISITEPYQPIEVTQQKEVFISKMKSEKRRQSLKDWKPGQVVENTYKVKTLLGEGGMGKVFKIYHINWDTDLAVKCPLPEMFRTEVQKEEFIREAETWVNLDLHPNIVTCYYVRTMDEVPRVFAEYVDGGSLKDWIEDGKLKDIKTKLDVAIQFAWGLAEAHKKGLVHQDIKPGNVMMTTDGIAKVTDFGLARAITAGARADVEHAGKLTIEYASPEQSVGQNLSYPTDVWSWATTVFEMVIGHRIWRVGPDAGKVIEEYIASNGETIPQGLGHLLRKCFQVESSARPNMEEISNELVRLYKEISGIDYSREVMDAVKLRADGLNNRALSLLDIGKKEEAKKFFKQALEIDPQNPNAMYNHGLIQWRTGRIIDNELVNNFKDLIDAYPEDEYLKYLLGLIHLEQGKPELTLKIFNKLDESTKKYPFFSESMDSIQMGKGKMLNWLGDLIGHKGPITSVSIPSNAYFAVTGSTDFGRLHDSTIKVWTLSNSQCICTLKHPNGGINDISVTPDGQYVLSAGDDKTARLWDIDSGNCIRVFSGFRKKVIAVDLSPDGRIAYIGNEDGTLSIFDMVNDECLQTLGGFPGWKNSMSISPDGRSVLFGDWGKTFYLIDLFTGKKIMKFNGHNERVNTVKISPDGRNAVSGSWDHTLKLWDLNNGTCIRTLKGLTHFVSSITFSPDCKYAFFGCGNEIRQWDLVSGKCSFATDGHPTSDSYTAISGDGQFIVSGSGSKLRFWKIRRDELILCPFMISKPRKTEEEVKTADTIEDYISQASEVIEKRLYAQGYEIAIKARNLPGFEKAPNLLDICHLAGSHGQRRGLRDGWAINTFTGHESGIKSISVSPEGNLVITGSYDGTFKIWDISTGKCIYTNRERLISNMTPSCVITSDGDKALTTSRENTLSLWELNTGQEIKKFKGHTKQIMSLAISSDSRLAISGGSDGSIRLWDIESGECIWSETPHMESIETIAISQDNTLFITADGASLKLWDLDKRDLIREIPVRGFMSILGAISPDNRFILTGSRALQLWDINNGECIRTFGEISGRHSRINAVAITSDSRFCFSACNNQIKIWDLSNGECLRTFEEHIAEVISLELFPNNRYLLSGSRDKTLRQWELDWDYEFPESRTKS